MSDNEKQDLADRIRLLGELFQALAIKIESCNSYEMQGELSVSNTRETWASNGIQVKDSSKVDYDISGSLRITLQ